MPLKVTTYCNTNCVGCSASSLVTAGFFVVVCVSRYCCTLRTSSRRCCWTPLRTWTCGCAKCARWKLSTTISTCSTSMSTVTVLLASTGSRPSSSTKPMLLFLRAPYVGLKCYTCVLVWQTSYWRIYYVRIAYPKKKNFLSSYDADNVVLLPSSV